MVPPGGGGATGGPAARVQGKVLARWRRSGNVTRVMKLWVTNVAKGSTIELRCANCGITRVTLRIGRAGTVQFTRLAPRRMLRPGSVLAVRLLAGGRTGKVTRFTAAANRLPRRSDLCLPPGAGTARRC